MKPTLNKSDVNLIRSILKQDFENLEKKIKKHVLEETGRIRLFFYEYFKEIKLEGTLKDHEQRITSLEEVTPGIPGH